MIVSKLRTILLAASLGGLLHAQKQVEGLDSGSVRLHPTDVAILEAGIPRTDLPCSVAPIKPKLDFDFLFHSGFQVLVPFKELDVAGRSNELTVLFRVSDRNRADAPVYMLLKVLVPPREDDKGVGGFDGGLALGEGNYHIDWMMRDRNDHVCAAFWDVEAKLSPKDAPLKPWIASGLIQSGEDDAFREEPPVSRAEGKDLLSVDIILNFAPRNSGSAMLAAEDVQRVMAMLRQVARDPRIGSFSLVACSLSSQKKFHEQETADYIDFPSIGEALRSLNLGTVDAKQLLMKERTARFAANLIRKQGQGSAADAVIVIGTKMPPESASSGEIAESFKELGRPVFYLHYTADPFSNPWRDVLGGAVKQSNGFEVEITQPRDLFNAWSDITSRILKARSAKGITF